ncbi:hypothetical protein G155_00188 [Mycobacterium sp. VKM Ac-1817D]|nr:hypothetical protein G155_00188 [Mycobacterium sp. VKM Ac-1817D]
MAPGLAGTAPTCTPRQCRLRRGTGVVDADSAGAAPDDYDTC